MTTITPATPLIPPAIPAPARARTADAGGGLAPADLVRILKQRIFLILFIWMVVTALGVGVTAYVERYYPQYSTEAFAEVESLAPPNPDDPVFGRTGGAYTTRDMELVLLNQSFLARSPKVISSTLQDPLVRRTSWFREADEATKKDSTLSLNELYKNAVNVSPVKKSSLLQFQASTANPQDAPILVNRTINWYIDAANQLSKDAYRNEVDELSQRIRAIEDRKKDLYQKRESHLAKYPDLTQKLAGQRTTADDDVSFYNALKNDYATQVLNFKAQWDMLAQTSTQGLRVNDAIVAAAEQSPIVVQYRDQLAQLEQARNNLLSRFLPQHRVVREYDYTIADMRERLEVARTDVQRQLLLQQIEDAKLQYTTAVQTLARLQDLYDDALARQADQQDKLKQYNEMTVEYDSANLQFDSLTQKLNQLNAVINRRQTVRIAQIGDAPVPKKLSRPDWMVWMTLAVFLGLGAGVGLALLLEFVDQSVRTPRDVLRHGELPVLGVIPDVEDDEVEVARIETATLDVPHSIIAEAFRNMRTNLFLAAPAEQQSVLLVTSPGPEEGKTTIAVNLACAIAMSGRRVLLVDANFRRPMLRQFFPDSRAEGMSNVLVGHAKLTDLAAPTSVAGLDVLTTGPVPPNPAELLSGGYLRNMIAEARAAYDQIIIDGPPVLLVSDSLVLAGACDGVIMVCRFRKTSRGTLQRARTQLERINAHILGAALNAIQTTRGGYFREQYRAFYDYRTEEAPPEPGTLPPPQGGPPTLEKE